MTDTISLPNLAELDQEAFGALCEPHRRELQTHCYRMLGSLQEAEDAVQETFLRAWRARQTYAGRAPVRAWLYRIATNLCLDRLDQQPRRSLPAERQAPSPAGAALPPAILEPIWLEPFPDDWLAADEDSPETHYTRRESVSLAFMTSLQALPPRQRAVLILRDVLDWPASDVSEWLELSVPAVKSALHRARTTLGARYHGRPSEGLSLRELDEPRRRQLDRYTHAWEMADVEALAVLLKAEATFSMPPNPMWVRGVDEVRELVGRVIFGGQPGRWRLRPARASGEAGFGLYRRGDTDGTYHAYGVQVVTFDGEQIADITTFRVPALVKYFGLAEDLT